MCSQPRTNMSDHLRHNSWKIPGNKNLSPQMNPRTAFDELMKIVDAETAKKIKRLISSGFIKPVVEYYNELLLSLPYRENDGSFISGVHCGQLKLLLSEIEYLTRIVEQHKRNNNGKHVVVVYAGAGPGHHIDMLADMFPDFKFLLVDPTPFELKIERGDGTVLGHRTRAAAGQTRHIAHFVHADRNVRLKNANCVYVSSTDDISNEVVDGSYQIYIYEDFFTDDLARSLAKTFEEHEIMCAFISDIRSISDPNVGVTNADILFDLAQQFIWTTILNSYGLLKFRLPFYDEANKAKTKFIDHMNEVFEEAARLGIDFREDYKNGVFRYISGKILIQPYSRARSTETRMVVGPVDGGNDIPTMLINPEVYERRMYAYNVIERVWIPHDNPYAGIFDKCDHCNDCALRIKIMTRYISVVYGNLPDGKFDQILGKLMDMSNAVTNYLRKPHGWHGSSQLHHT